MYLSNSWIKSVFGTAILAVGVCVCLFRKIYVHNKRDEKIEKQYVGEVIFFTGANVYCRKYCLTKRKPIPCGRNCSYDKLKYIISLINNAESTIDICIYLITCNDLAFAIIRAFKHGIKVRVIIDEEMASSTESKINWFIDAGIPVKSKRTNILMHHKFCVIDVAKPNNKLLTGSLNWTLQGLAGNYEYITITSHPIPVMEYHKEFNILWENFNLKN